MKKNAVDCEIANSLLDMYTCVVGVSVTVVVNGSDFNDEELSRIWFVVDLRLSG